MKEVKVEVWLLDLEKRVSGFVYRAFVFWEKKCCHYIFLKDTLGLLAIFTFTYFISYTA